MTTECIFCEVMAGRAPADFVYEDPLTVAVIDPRQHNPGMPADADPASRTRYAERIRQVLEHE